MRIGVWILSMAIVAVTLPFQGNAQESSDVQRLGTYQDWSAVRYEDPFGENSGTGAVNEATDRRLMVVCYDNGLTGVSLTISNYVGEEETRNVKWVTDASEVHEGQWRVSDSGIQGSSLVLVSNVHGAAIDALIREAKEGLEINFRVTGYEETTDVKFSLKGFTAAYEQACGG